NFHLLKISYSFINTSLFSLHSLQTCHNAQIEQRLCQGGANSVCHLAIPRSTRFVRCLHSIATANSLAASNITSLDSVACDKSASDIQVLVSNIPKLDPILGMPRPLVSSICTVISL
ncbi:hypothetical protein QWA68_001077, partial [Fusarium oxysporum]